MARAEATATSAGILFMNQYLQEKFPHRTLEAVKGKRRQEAYRGMVQAFSQEVASSFDDVDDAGNTGDAAMIGVARPSMETVYEEPQPAPQLVTETSGGLRGVVEELRELVGRLRSYEAVSGEHRR